MKPCKRFTVDSAGVIVLFFLFMISGFVPFFLPAPVNAYNPWKGYAVFLAERSVPPSRVAESLSEAGISGIISENTASVSFFAFDGEGTLQMNEIGDRLDREDPRYDEYMKRLPSYFHTRIAEKEYDLYYLPGNAEKLGMHFFFSPAMRTMGGKWRLVGWNPLAQVVFLFFYIVLVAAVVLRRGKQKGLFLLGGISWLPFLMGGDALSFAAASLVFLTWVVAVREIRPFFLHRLYYPQEAEGAENMFRKALYPFSLAIFCFILFLFPSADIYRAIAALSAVSANIFIVIWAACRESAKMKTREHRLFIPLSILGSGRKTPAARSFPRFVPVLVFAMLIAPTTAVSLASSGSVRVPVFQSLTENGRLTRKTIEELWIRRKAESLPDLADYFSHRAFQDGFLYGRKYGFPAADEELYLPVFNGTFGEKLHEMKKPVLRFDTEWFDNALNDIPPAGIEQLLISQKTAGFAAEELIEPAAAPRSTVIKIIILYAFWCIQFVPAGKNLTSPTLYGMRSTLVRRKRQEA